MTNIAVALLAYLIDKIFGEFKYIKHPIIIIGQIISTFEKKYYKDSVIKGFYLLIFTLFIVTLFIYIINIFISWSIILSSIFASMFLAHNMLYESVKDILSTTNKREAISKLVSRDTKNMSESDIYKAAIETYAENLNDGVIAPLLYLLFFGLPGIVIYKTINTLDSMVGYRDQRYENFGKASAILDDIVNYIPARITAILIMLLNKKYDIFSCYKNATMHDSPNAGHPITAIALVLGIKLGGKTSYFGKVRDKAYFGVGRESITKLDLIEALSIKTKIDFTILISLSLLYLIIIFL